jgi:myo-inositol-1(or 4)-monophosphatase
MSLTKDLYKDVKPIIFEAGNILLSFFRTNFKVSLKNQQQYVTEADLKSEAFLKDKLLKLLPDASFLGEESGKSGKNDYCWVIDPLDGTTNFSYGVPYFCISVALTYKNEPILGLIFDPLRKDLFYASKGQGAFLNDNRIYVSKKEDVSKCFISTSFPDSWKEAYQQNWKAIEIIRRNSYSMRLMGAAALDLANVAASRFDASFFQRLEWWDIAAGIILIEEAGGIVTDFSGNKLIPGFESFVAASAIIHPKLIELLEPVYKGY